ncbi:multidrug efflux pump [Arboricoccus pini]|uniref:Multidrug efflux pump n=1 Tax=Arboricoccus pini TaxID=1963835 RepID=A0A212R8P5_9PROT|nr:efflux RND transporter permease subunit [Arboricoccus pini]SNB68383.1 multidrug efflux pump [Arboricoccus pini]
MRLSVSAPFIRRPIATLLLSIALLLTGLIAYPFLPVASLPMVDLPTIRVTASEPGADPETIAATLAAPLERRMGEIAGVTSITSSSTLGSTNINVQFDLSRDIDGAARDVQAAINAAAEDLPSDLTQQPRLRKSNPASIPILILAMTSDQSPSRDLYDVADTTVGPRLSQIEGVAEVTVSGGEQPAIRVAVDPRRLAARGIKLDDVRTAIANSNVLSPLGVFDSSDLSITIGLNGQLKTPAAYAEVPIKLADGTIVRLGDIATIREGSRSRLNAGWFNQKPAILLFVQKAADANTVATVARIRAQLPKLAEFIPAGMSVNIVSDRTEVIQASVHDLQFTLLLSAVLVMAVVAVFLRRIVPTLAAGLALPLSLAGTLAVMWILDYSLDNLSLMALTISVGFVVDDAIVMIENVFAHLERGMRPLRAAMEGARQIGFTVISISISLVAAFIPILFMSGIQGRFLREFAVTLSVAVVISAIVSLVVTPVVCAYFIKRSPRPGETWLDRRIEPLLDALASGYERSLRWALKRRAWMSGATLVVLIMTIGLFRIIPAGTLPQDDTSLMFGSVQGPANASFERMKALQEEVIAILRQDPAIESVASSIGSSVFSAGNSSNMFVALKPFEQRDASIFQVIERLRPQMQRIIGAQVFFFPAQEVPTGPRQTSGQFQYTLWSPDLTLLTRYAATVTEAMRKVDGVTDVSNDRNEPGPQARLIVDRDAASRLGVSMQDIDAALNDAFSQRQISTMYGSRNQYQVVLEAEGGTHRSLAGIGHIYLAGTDGASVPLSALIRIVRDVSPLTVNHQGQFPSVTISYNLRPGTAPGTALAAINEMVDGLHLPDEIHTIPISGFSASSSQEGLLLIAAVIAVYLTLGILYESLRHPLTIISTLPSAGLGALLALKLFGMDLSLIALIGILLLIGIVKKNGIMLVDFALQAERNQGLPAKEAITRAAVERFRPIMMTTLAALLGAVPLLIFTGPGSALRRPLGVAIVGGLLISQLLTIYTTPVIYLLMDKIRWPFASRSGEAKVRQAPLMEP